MPMDDEKKLCAVSQPDQGYNQWVEFHMKYINFPDTPHQHGFALKSEKDIDLECGRLYIGSRDVEIEKEWFPVPFYPSWQRLSFVGACGRYCAAMGTRGAIILSEQTALGIPATVGEPALRIRWQCLYKSYSDNYLEVYSLNKKHYQVTLVPDPPKDRAIGIAEIQITYLP